MPTDREPSCAVRGRWDARGEVRVSGRHFTLDAVGSAHLDHDEARPSALELLVSALVADLLAGLGRECQRAGVRIHDAEMAISAYLDNPLVALGVVGEAGTAAVASLNGSLYVSSDADAEALASLWNLALERAPVHATLRRCVDLDIELKPVI
jgi:uncharacterized OsmC-like protein